MAGPKRSSLLKTLGPALNGALDPQTGLVGRRHVRTQGCWNCKHGAGPAFDKAKEVWQGKRQQDLAKATEISIASPLGEEDPTVKNIRHMVNLVDHGLASGNLTMCTGKGRDAKGNPVGDFVKSNYLCDRWSGATGASIAREGQKADDLPMELEDKGN